MGKVNHNHNASRTARRMLLASVLASLMFGCGGGKAEAPAASTTSGDEGPAAGPALGAPAHAKGDKEATASIGPAGGTLELSNGVRVEIPAGASAEERDYVLSEAPDTTAFLNEEAERPWGPTFVVSPGVDAPEGQSITVSVPLAAYPEGWGDVSIAYEYPVADRVGAEDSQHTRWQYDNAKLAGGRAVAQLPAVNGFRLQFVLTNLEAQ